MPELPVDASKFAGVSEEQARTFPRRDVVGVELSDAQAAAMPKMISTDAHVMEPDALWQELTPRLRDQLPKVPFRNYPPGASDPTLRLRDQDTDGVAAEILFPNYGMALFGIDDIETRQESFKLYNDWIHDFCSADPKRLYGAPLRVRLRHRGRHQGDAARPFHGPEGRDGLAGAGPTSAIHVGALRAVVGRLCGSGCARDLSHSDWPFLHQDRPEARPSGAEGRRQR